MIKKTILLLTTVLLFAQASVTAHGQSRELEIVTFGDSITAGLRRNGNIVSCPPGVSLEPARYSGNGLGCYGDGVVNAGGYQLLLKDNLDLIGYQATLYNWGFSGIDTAEMVNELDAAVSAQPNAKYVLIMAGANDAFQAVSESTFRFNVSKMIDIVLAQNMTPIIGTPTPITISLSLNKRTKQYTDEIKQLASQRNVMVSNHNSIMQPSWETVPYHSGDRLHMSSAGNTQLSLNWQNTLNLEPITSTGLEPIYLLLLDD